MPQPIPKIPPVMAQDPLGARLAEGELYSKRQRPRSGLCLDLIQE